MRVHTRDVDYGYGSDVPGSLADPDAPLALTNNVAPGDFMTID